MKATDAAKIVIDAFAGSIGRLPAPIVIGLSGAQGSGKSTLAKTLEAQLSAAGTKAAVLSLDDLYLSKAERRSLAERVHPLFATRGVPGTHDITLAIEVINAVKRGEAVRAPTFDKGADDRRSSVFDNILPASLDVLVFEGWCVGARAGDDASLAKPINTLERESDGDGVWRRAVNDFLGAPYQDLFARLDRLVFMRAPSFDVVCKWRIEQENDLGASGVAAPALMSEFEIANFIQFYERITRNMLADVPSRADLTISLDDKRRVIGVTKRAETTH